jgi:hypothetical protein
MMEPFVEGNDAEQGMVLLPGEGIAIQIVNTAVVGDIITGCISWSEIEQAELIER